MNSLTANAPPNPPTKRHTTTPDKTAGLIPLSTSVSEQEMYDMSRINLDFPEHGCPKGPETKNLCFVINQLSWSCEWQITTTVFFVVIYPSPIRGEKKHLSYTPIVELISIFHTKKKQLSLGKGAVLNVLSCWALKCHPHSRVLPEAFSCRLLWQHMEDRC